MGETEDPGPLSRGEHQGKNWGRGVLFFHRRFSQPAQCVSGTDFHECAYSGGEHFGNDANEFDWLGQLFTEQVSREPGITRVRLSRSVGVHGKSRMTEREFLQFIA